MEPLDKTLLQSAACILLVWVVAFIILLTGTGCAEFKQETRIESPTAGNPPGEFPAPEPTPTPEAE